MDGVYYVRNEVYRHIYFRLRECFEGTARHAFNIPPTCYIVNLPAEENARFYYFKKYQESLLQKLIHIIISGVYES